MTSPSKENALRLTDTKNPWTYNLKIIHRGIEIAHYPIEGELISAYWSPWEKFVVINNHSGHFGFWPWIISLTDGSIITSHGVIKDRNYDRYLDYHYVSNLRQVASAALKQAYSGAYDDQLREGYDSVAYGWTGEDQLLIFHEFPYDYLFERENRIIQAYSTWKVTDHSSSLKNIVFKKVKDWPDEPMPREVYKTLNFMN